MKYGMNIISRSPHVLCKKIASNLGSTSKIESKEDKIYVYFSGIELRDIKVSGFNQMLGLVKTLSSATSNSVRTKRDPKCYWHKLYYI